jgi:hypothetical protein
MILPTIRPPLGRVCGCQAPHPYEMNAQRLLLGEYGFESTAAHHEFAAVQYPNIRLPDESSCPTRAMRSLYPVAAFPF